MLAMFRRFLGTWTARVFFIVLIGSFGLWGISGVVHDFATDNSLAQVGSRRIQPGEFQVQYRRALAQVSRMMGGQAEPTPAISRAVAGQTLERMVVEAALDDQAAQLGVVVPPEEVRRAVFDIPGFRGPNGAFDRNKFNAVMRDNNLTEAGFLEQVRANLAQNQVMDAVTAGVAPPDALTGIVFAFQRETRVAEYVELPFALAPEPPAPTADDLQRQYENNLPSYSAAEFRRIKVVLLSPDTAARATDVSDEDIKAYYDQHQAEFVREEKRSVHIVSTSDEARARSLAAAWSAGAGWDDIQHQAEAGASAITLDDAGQAEIPSPELAAAVFSAAPDAVVGPVGSPLGWQVFQVFHMAPGVTTTLADATAGIRATVAKERAADGMYDRINTLEDAVAASPTLDEIPAGLGAVAASGTLDARGNTQDGEPAPIPGTPAQRQAILTAAFALQKGEPARLSDGPENSHFAVLVEDTTAATPKPLSDVEAAVRQDWLHAARRKSQEEAAARLMTAAKAGGSLDDAATVAGLRVQRTPPLPRGAPPSGVPQELATAAFSLKPKDATMVEVPDAFLVAALGDVSKPDMSADPIGAGQTRKQLADSMSKDVQNVYASALRTRMRPSVNQRVLDSIVQPPS